MADFGAMLRDIISSGAKKRASGGGAMGANEPPLPKGQQKRRYGPLGPGFEEMRNQNSRPMFSGANISSNAWGALQNNNRDRAMRRAGLGSMSPFADYRRRNGLPIDGSADPMFYAPSGVQGTVRPDTPPAPETMAGVRAYGLDYEASRQQDAIEDMIKRLLAGGN